MNPLSVLLAEDDPHIAMIAKLSLEKLGGHKVRHVLDGESALKVATNGEDFDVILLDEMMPKMNGLKVSRELKSQGVRTPIIFLSAKSQEADIRAFLELGCGYIAKPFDPQALNSQIHERLGLPTEAKAA